MSKISKILSVLIATVIVAMIPIITNTFTAASEVYGPLGAYSVFVKNDFSQAGGTLEGRLAVGNNMQVSGENANFATGYNAETVLGYYLESTEYPSIVVQNAIELATQANVSDGGVTGSTINDEQLLNLEGADFSFTQDTPENLAEGFAYFTQQADGFVEDLMSREIDENDPNPFQNYDSYYDSKDKSLIITDITGTKLSTSDPRYEQSVVTSEMSSEESSEQEGLNTEALIEKVAIGKLQAHEKLIIRSDAQYVTFDNTYITYEGQRIELDVLDNEDVNVERLSNDIVWVFPNAKEVLINNSSVVGSILAPNATVTQNGGYLAGQLYANNFIQKNNGYIVNRVDFINDYDFNRAIDSSTLTIEFKDTAGNDVHDPMSFTREVGTTFATDLPDIDGYTIKNTATYETIESGLIMQPTDETMTIEYQALFSAKLTVYHQLSDGTNIVEPQIQYMEVGDAYTTQALSDENYSLTSNPTNASGTMTENVEVTYVYAPIASVGTITIRHVDSSGNNLMVAQTIKSEIGKGYDVSTNYIASSVYQYKGLYTGSAPASGTLNSDITVIFEYAANTTCSQLGSTTSGANADQSLSLKNVRRVTPQEIEYDEVQGSKLVEQAGTQVSDTTKYNFGTEYQTTTAGTDTFIDYRYSFNGTQNYTQFTPIRQTGAFEPINVVISNDGNGYDLRSRNNVTNIADNASNGVNYQKTIATQGYKSLNIKFEECQAVVSFNNADTAANGTVIATFQYTDFPNLDETVAGYSTTWDAATKVLTVNIIFEKDQALYYSGNTFAIDLSTKDFLPQDYALAYQNTADTATKVYRPYTNNSRYMLEVTALQSPYIDTTSTQHSLSTAMGYNEIYEIYSINGKVESRTKLTSSNNIVSYSLPYNPKKYQSMITKSFPHNDSNVYSYIAGSTKTPVSGLTLKAESQVIYGKNKHPKYSMSVPTNAVSIPANKYESLIDDPDFKYDVTSTLNGEQETTSTLAPTARYFIVNEDNVDFTVKGDYTAFGYVQSVDPTSGEFINAMLNTNVTVTGSVLDYGDAPQSYGPAGALIGDSKHRYNIGVNRNGNRSTHADAESEPQYSTDARGDDTTGITDETGWFNMDPSGIGELNVEMEKMRLSFPYTASGNAIVIFWLDYNQNGVFEDFEGTAKNVTTSSYDDYGIVNFDINLNEPFSTLEAGDSTYARIRILSSKQNMSVTDANTTYNDYYGETEDFQVNMYGKKNEYQICTQILANTPIVTSKSYQKVSGVGPNKDESGIRYTFDIGEANPNSNSSNSFYPDVKVTVSSKQGIVANTGNGDPAYFRVEQSTSGYESPPNTIHISSRNKDGDPINLPFTFSFWDLDDFTGLNVVESVSIDKNSVYLEGLEASDIKTTYDGVGIVEDYDSYVKLFTTKQVESDPSAAFYLQGSSLAKSDISIVEEARLLEIGMGLDLGQMDKLITECVEPYEPEAQIQVFDDFYKDEVQLYNSFPFKYQSTNVVVPYFSNFNSVEQKLYIPDGVEFVDDNTDVTIYRRDFLGNRTEADWEVVDPSMYTQTLDPITNTSTVEFKDPIANNIYGYEYRMEYNFEISDEMETGQEVVFKSDVIYNKGKTGEYTETYHLNDVKVIVREAFTADLNTVMGDDTIHVENSSSKINYTYEYKNCDSCTNVTTPQPLTGDITIPIPDKADMDFYSTSDFDQYEDIVMSIYDNGMKVFEVPIRRWYPTALDVNIADNTELQEIADNLNPVGQTIQIRANYTKFPGFEQPVKVGYTQEVINVEQSGDTNTAENAILAIDNIKSSISTNPTDKVPASWQPSYWSIDVDDLMPIFDPELVYIPNEAEICSETVTTNCKPQDYHLLNIAADALDPTLETSKTTINNVDYKDIYFKDTYTVDEQGNIILSSKLDDRYVIEKYSGRIYNEDISSECKLESAVDSDYQGKLCYADVINNYDEPTDVYEQIINGYNDASDQDEQINATITNGMPLNANVELGDKFNYYLYLSDFGLNNTSVTVADQVEITSLPIGYYKEDGDYYFKRINPTDEEVDCIKDNTCNDEYQVLTSGSITDTYEIQNKIKNNPNLLENYASSNDWIRDYIKVY